MRKGRRIKDVRRCNDFSVIGVRTHWRQRSTIHYTFDLNDDGVERVDVEDIPLRCAYQMALEEPHHALMNSTEVRRSGRDEGPHQTFLK